MKKIVVTGATGALGPAVLRSLERTFPQSRIWATTRKESFFPANVTQVVCDLRNILSEDHPEFAELFRDADAVVHMAADVRWSLGLRDSIAANVELTKSVLAMTERHSKVGCRFIQMSTAFADPPPRVLMDVFTTVGDSVFANAYEYSKMLADEAVQASPLDWTILRPSLVVGATDDGMIGRYHGIYLLLTYGAKGCLPVLPGLPDAPVDFVPADFVGQRLCDALVDRTYVGVIAPIVSGSSSMPVSDVINTALVAVNKRRAAARLKLIDGPSIISPSSYKRFFHPLLVSELKPSVKRLFDTLEAYNAYFGLTVPFENGAVPAPDPEDYLPRVVDCWCDDNPDQMTATLFDWEKAVRRDGPAEPERMQSRSHA
ncbi:MAG: SDR family oxidoreductase [Erythrobacter sp.]|nr:SDR family oxidoreductase [Erythrobacter sp.]